jgi:hypothetical protein
MVQRTQVRALDLQTSALPLPGAGSFRPDGTVYLLRFADCTVYISVRDEASKIDLNKAPEVLLAALFVSVGVDPAKA